MLDQSAFCDETTSLVQEERAVEAEQNEEMYTPSAISFFLSDVVIAL